MRNLNALIFTSDLIALMILATSEKHSQRSCPRFRQHITKPSPRVVMGVCCQYIWSTGDSLLHVEYMITLIYKLPDPRLMT